MLKSITSILAATALMVPAVSMAQAPSFPGAEGYGRITTGGRGGKVYHVTTLEDNNEPGSFRYACNQSGTRTIVFDVDGTIFLKSDLSLSNGNVTIAGQTAPGDGICIADYPFTIKANNVIIRFIRFRLGNRQVAHHEGDGLGGMDQSKIIVDHCSVSWSIDECLSVYGNKNTTVQWCIVSQSLRESGHSKGSHGYGGNWGGSGASYHHNLIAHHTSRTPRLGPRPGTQTDERMDMRNNVIYNHGANGCYGGEGMNVNIVNNYYKTGPTSNSRPERIAGIGIRTSEYTGHDSASPNQWDVMWHKWGTFYVDGNMNPKAPNMAKDNWQYGIYNQIDKSGNDGTFNDNVARDMRLDTPIEYVYTTTHTAEKAYEKVLEYAGASFRRDALDDIIINDVKTGTAKHGNNGIIDNQNQVKYSDGSTGWPKLNSGTAKPDTDGDGIPDEWETANGLNPNDASDGPKIAKDGYTNLEIYMNSLVQHIMDGGNAEGKMLGGNLEYSDNAIEIPDYVEPETEELVIDGSSYVGSTSTTSWEFFNGITVTNTRNKGYSTGSNSCVKYSSGVQFTVNLPEGVTVNGITVTGYDNYTDGDSYFGEVNGVDGSSYIFPRTKEVVTHEIPFSTPAVGSFTFTPQGKQVVLSILLKASRNSGILNIASDDINPAGDNRIYNLQGIEVSEPLAPGIYIRDGKKFLVK